jgi:hypothetical protein
VLGRSRHDTEDFLIVRQPERHEGASAALMTLPTAGNIPTHSPPRLLLRCLRALLRELDDVLSSSTTGMSPIGVDEANSAAVPLARADRSVRRGNDAGEEDGRPWRLCC